MNPKVSITARSHPRSFSPALIHSSGAMKCLLDAMLVLTKQDRLCHIIHATSEPFYQTWLRKANVMQHCKVRAVQKPSLLPLCTHSGRSSQILTIGDCTKPETRAFFRDRIIPHVPERLRMGLSFEHLWDAFGGKLAHWQDYITDYGRFPARFRSIVPRAHGFPRA